MGTVLTPRNDVCKGAEGMQYIGVDVRRSSKRHRSEAELMMYKKRGSRAPGNVVEIKEAPIDMNKACHEKKERSQPFLLCATINGRSESIRLVIDKQPWLQFREVPCAIISLVGAFFVFDLAYPSLTAEYLVGKFREIAENQLVHQKITDYSVTEIPVSSTSPSSAKARRTVQRADPTTMSSAAQAASAAQTASSTNPEPMPRQQKVLVPFLPLSNKQPAVHVPCQPVHHTPFRYQLFHLNNMPMLHLGCFCITTHSRLSMAVLRACNSSPEKPEMDHWKKYPISTWVFCM
ncbi:hypothetical protein ACROYT_G014620 [Oculina patagonica]